MQLGTAILYGMTIVVFIFIGKVVCAVLATHGVTDIVSGFVGVAVALCGSVLSINSMADRGFGDN